MANKYFDIVVNKLVKYKWKLMDMKKLRWLVKNILDSEFTEKKLYKIIYYLKNRQHLENLKKNVFFVIGTDKKYNKQEILEMFYWNIVKKHCDEFLKSKYYIWWLKALELNLSSFDVPEELLIVNQYKQATEVVMFDKQMLFKTYWRSSRGKENLFGFFYKFSKKIKLNKYTFNIACMELAILESLYNPSMVSKWYVIELVKKILRKQWKSLDFKIWENILRKNKHHTSINRLYKIALSIDPTLSENLKALIKRYSYFIN